MVLRALVLIFIPNLLQAQTFSELKAQRLDGSSIQFYLTRPSTGLPVPLLLILQGSSCSSIYKSALGAGRFVEQNKIARLDIEKFDLNKDATSCPLGYLNNNTIDQRIADSLRVMQVLRDTSSSWWNGKLMIVGGSEGGTIAPILASYIPETTKLVVMAGGTGWTMRESMPFLLEKELRSKGADEQTIDSELKNMETIFDDVIKNPTSTKVYNGNTNTYKWWNSILNLRPRNFMIDLKIPILMVHGDVDSACPVESARATADAFKTSAKTNFKYIEYPGLDHHWNDSAGQSHANQIFTDVFTWVSR